VALNAQAGERTDGESAEAAFDATCAIANSQASLLLDLAGLGDAHRLVSALGTRLKSQRVRSRLHRCNRRYRGGGHRRRSSGLVRLAPRRSTQPFTSRLGG